MEKIKLNQFFYECHYDYKGLKTLLGLTTLFISFNCNGNELLIPIHRNPLNEDESSIFIEWIAPAIPKLRYLDFVMYSETIKKFFEIIRNFSRRDKRDNLFYLKSFENEKLCLRFEEILVLIDNGYGKENIIPINNCDGLEKTEELKLRFSNLEVIPIKIETKNINDIVCEG